MIDIDVKVENSGNVSDMDNVIKTLIANADYFRELTVDEFLSIRNFFYGYAKIDIAELVFKKL